MTRQRARTTGRASPSAIEKRRTARELNTLLGGTTINPNDGRTQRRRSRLLREIKEGRGNKPLKAIELLTRVNALLSLGETVASIRKNGVLLPTIALTADAHDLIERTQAAYDFDPEVWKVLGMTLKATRTRAAHNTPSVKKTTPRR